MLKGQVKGYLTTKTEKQQKITLNSDKAARDEGKDHQTATIKTAAEHDNAAKHISTIKSTQVILINSILINSSASVR